MAKPIEAASTFNPDAPSTETVVEQQQGGALIMRIGEPTGEHRERIERQLAEARHELENRQMDSFKAAVVEQCIQDFNIPRERFEGARNLIQSVLQNGHTLGVEASGTGSVAHIAASVPDIAMFLAIYEVGGPLNDPNADGATPAHVVALRAVTEVAEGKKAAQVLKRLDVSFVKAAAPDLSPPVAVVDEDWPGFWQQWRGWKAMNARKLVETGQAISTVQLFMLYWAHRRTVREVRSFLYNLG